MPVSELESIIIIPQVNFEELKLWYKYANLFIYPSYAEGFGIPPIEAAAAGIPVISNNATAMSDFSFLGNNLIDINNRDILDDRVKKLLNKSTDNAINNISELVRTKYNWSNIATEFNKILTEKF